MPGRNRLLAVRLPDAVAPLVAEAAGDENLAQPAFCAGTRCRRGCRGSTALHAGLYDAAVFFRGLDSLAAFPHVVRDRFLDIHILARLAAPDRHNECQ